MTNALEDMLREERLRLTTEEVELEAAARETRERLVEVRRRLDHIRGLLNEEASMENSDATPKAGAGYSTGAASNICDIAESVLSERNGEPMYYKDLAREVNHRGGNLGGVDPAATLTARMVSDGRFIRPTAKGFYALRRDYPNARNVGARRHRRRRAG